MPRTTRTPLDIVQAEENRVRTMLMLTQVRERFEEQHLAAVQAEKRKLEEEI